VVKWKNRKGKENGNLANCLKSIQSKIFLFLSSSRKSLIMLNKTVKVPKTQFRLNYV